MPNEVEVVKERKVARWDKGSHAGFVRDVAALALKHDILVSAENDKGRGYRLTGMQWPSPTDFTFVEDGVEKTGTAQLQISLNLTRIGTAEGRAASRQEQLANVVDNMTPEELAKAQAAIEARILAL
jgi:hypothetical protein